MKTNNEKYNRIILIVVFLMFLLLLVIMLLLNNYQDESTNEISNTTSISVTIDETDKSYKTVKEVVEAYGSKYINREKSVFIRTYVNFLYDLYDENGNSKKGYFYNMIDDIVDVEQDCFYLIDNDKNITIFVNYDAENDTYTVTINDSEDYYDETDGEVYIALQDAEIVEQSTSLIVTNKFIDVLSSDNMKYSGTEYFQQADRIDLGNGYYSVENGTVLGRLKSGKVLNLLLEEGYEEEITDDITVGTSLSKIYEKHSDNAFGNVSDGYLGYRTRTLYIFFYRDEVSIYGYKYAENEYFDEYLEEYCSTGDLATLYQNFTENFTTYFENEYDENTQSLKLTYPLRGIEIDITGNDSTGIKIYSNYCLTDTVTQLIKDGKITYVGDKDLINETEKARRAGE